VEHLPSSGDRLVVVAADDHEHVAAFLDLEPDGSLR
jgi:hypothetical protein